MTEKHNRPNSAWSDHLDARLAAWRKQGLARELKVAEGPGVRFSLRGKTVLSFAANDYLDLSNHPEVVAAAKAALDENGAGATASPLIVGHKSEHAKLEAALCAFKQSEAALVFPSGFQAALAAIGTLAGENDTVILDRLAHASLIDGAKLSGARVRAFKHNDVEDLRRIIRAESETPPPGPLPVSQGGGEESAAAAATPSPTPSLKGRGNNSDDATAINGRRVLVVIESLYSMDGDQARLDEIVGVCNDAGAMLLVDEAHATGVLGASGRGALEALTQKNGALPENVIAMGTLSKALGSQGGFVCASKRVIDTIVHAGRAYLFSTALAPAACAAARAALKLVDSEPERRVHLIQLANSLRSALLNNKFDVVPGSGPVIAVLTGDEKRATQWSNALLAKGIYVPAIRYPTVKKGQARLRISLSSAHRREDCQALLNALKELH